VKKLIGLALEPPLLRLGFAERQDKRPSTCRQMKKNDLFNERCGVARARGGFSNLNRTKPTPL
jgi:hypothetical protein